MRPGFTTTSVTAVMLLTLVIALSVPPALAAGPILELSPASAAAGETVKATGRSFPAGKSGTVAVNGSTVASFRTSGAGEFSTSFSVPPHEPGVVPVTAKVRRTSVTASLTVLGSTTPTSSTTTTTPSNGPVRLAPRHVVATQGPTDPSNLYALVTWDRSDPTATAYQVLRDGAVVGTIAVAGDPWDDLAYKDTSVQGGQSYGYQVRGAFPGGAVGELSATTAIRIRSDADLGRGKVFEVDRQTGETDLDKAQAAVDAAKAEGGGVVLFGARTYRLDRALEISATDNVVLRGAGIDSTFIQPAFPGASSPSGAAPDLIRFTGTTMKLSTTLTRGVNVGDRSVSVNSTAGLAPGQVIVFDQKHAQAEPTWFESNGILQDPGSGRDERYRWDANEIAAVDAGSSVVHFKYPFSQSFTSSVPWLGISSGSGNGIEQLTVQGRSSAEATYYRLVTVKDQSRMTIADVQSRWANQSYAHISGYDIRMVGFRGPDGGPNNYTDGISKYKVSVARASNFTFVGGLMGEPGHDRNKSYLTTQWAQRTLVRQSQFLGSRTYAFNEHGGGSRDVIFENNYVTGTTNTEYGGVYLGNSTWGFAGSAIVRNNLQVGGPRFLHMEENSYEIRVLDNVVRDLAPSPLPRGTTSARFIYGEGWKGPDTAPELHASLRMTVQRNTISNVSGDGVDVGRAGSNFYPILGVKDVLISDNSFGVSGTAVRLQGSRTDTRRFQVFNNTGTNRYVRPELIADDYWSGNMDGISYGTPTAVDWSAPLFAWEAYDQG